MISAVCSSKMLYMTYVQELIIRWLGQGLEKYFVEEAQCEMQDLLEEM